MPTPFRPGALLPPLATLLFLFAAPCLLPAQSLAQTGTISGTVKDGSGGPLSGVSVIVLGKQMGAFTNMEGKFTIPHVPVGSYTIRANQVGYTREE